MPDSSNARIALGLVGALVFVEFISGFLQNYYMPVIADIGRYLNVNDADLNWLEAAQFLMSALCVPPLSKLADFIGHRRMLFWAAIVVAAATWGIAFSTSFGVYLSFWAIQGVLAVWLPLEVALIFLRSAGDPDQADNTRNATGTIVAALMGGAIAAAIASPAASAIFDDMRMVLAVPAVLATIAVLIIWPMSDAGHVPQPAKLDLPGLAMLAGILILVSLSLTLIRLLGYASPWPWISLTAGLTLIIPFTKFELGRDEPIVDFRVMAARAMWPVQLTSLLLGITLVSAAIPLSTYAQTDPHEYGFGLGLEPAYVGPILLGYAFAMLIGATIFGEISSVVGPRNCLIGAMLLVAGGYGAMTFYHDSFLSVAFSMTPVGFGSGAMLAAIPAAAAAAAPAGGTGIATGLTGMTRTIGGSIASCVFGVALAAGAGTGTAASLSGYYTVWIVSSVAAVVAAITLFFVPATAFVDEAA